MIKNLLGDDEQARQEGAETPASGSRKEPPVLSLFGTDAGSNSDSSQGFLAPNPEPHSLAETARQSGLAWSLGIAFFSAVGFMMILGWGADLLFGSSPWGVVAGIVIGSVIGFFQLFRVSSQIFKQ